MAGKVGGIGWDIKSKRFSRILVFRSEKYYSHKHFLCKPGSSFCLKAKKTVYIRKYVLKQTDTDIVTVSLKAG